MEFLRIFCIEMFPIYRPPLLLFFVWTSSKLDLVLSFPSYFTSTFGLVLPRFPSFLIKAMELELTSLFNRFAASFDVSPRSSHGSCSPFRNHPSRGGQNNSTAGNIGQRSEPTNSARTRIGKIFTFFINVPYSNEKGAVCS